MAPGRATAFSLIEVLCSLGVVAVLLAIILPALSRTRTSAQGTQSLIRIRECGSLILSHSNDRKGEFPLAAMGGTLVDSRGPTAEIRLPGEGVLGVSWFEQSSAWNFVLMGAGEPATEVWYSPTAPADPIVLPFSPALRAADYIMTQAVMAEAGFWNDLQNQRPDYCKVMRVEQVRSPSRKGLLVERTNRVSLRAEREVVDRKALEHPICFVDGHVVQRPLLGAGSTIPNSLSNGVDYPVLTTRFGVNGVDF